VSDQRQKVMVQTAGFAEVEAASMTLFASLLPSLLPSSIAIDTTTTTIQSGDASYCTLIMLS
jgi:hypothetical protein